MGEKLYALGYVLLCIESVVVLIHPIEKRVQRAKEVAAEQAPADATAPPSRAGSASAAPPPSQAPADDAMDVVCLTPLSCLIRIHLR